MDLASYLQTKPAPEDVFAFLRANPQKSCLEYSHTLARAAEARGQPGGMVVVADTKDLEQPGGHRLAWWGTPEGTVKLASNADAVKSYGSLAAMMNDLSDVKSGGRGVRLTNSSGNVLDPRDESEWFINTEESIASFRRGGRADPDGMRFVDTIYRNLK